MKKNRFYIYMASLVALLQINTPANASGRDTNHASTVPPHPSAATLETLGRKLFFDPQLSASRQLSCASCHDPAHAFGPADDLAVANGGRDLKQQGMRTPPSLRYQQNVPAFTEHYHDEDFDESIDNGPTGGHTWDGRAPNVHDQARIPLLSPLEMANSSPEQVVDAIRHAQYADEFRRVFGKNIFANSDAAFKSACIALEVFQQNPTEFYPYSSKYDAFLRGQVQLSEREQHGLELFNAVPKGNCAHCHPSAIGANGAFPAFSDFGYVALGLPRNRTLTINSVPDFYDLGLCGPLREDLKDRTEYCGLFRAPSLRNIALRKSFFHNGSFHTLKDAIRFYVERDIHPEKYYPRNADGSVNKFDDLPQRYQNNINIEPPFDHKPGDAPALSDSEIDDVIAFLNTLTDGFLK